MDKHFDLEKLPAKYFNMYAYAKEVITTLKATKVVTKLENKEGMFTLLENDCFEAIFSTGFQVYF